MVDENHPYGSNTTTYTYSILHAVWVTELIFWT